MGKDRIEVKLKEVETFPDLVEFIANDLQYHKLMDAEDNIQEQEFWGGLGKELHLKKEDRTLVRIVKVEEGEESIGEIKRHIKKGPKNQELFSVFTFVEEDSDKIVDRIRFFWLNRRIAEEDVDIEYDLKYFEIEPKDPEPVYYEYLDDIRVGNKSLEVLEDDESEIGLREAFSIDKITNKFYSEFQDIIEERLQPAISGLDESNVGKHHYAQVLVNRVLFLMFIEEKKWLSKEPDNYQGDKKYIEEKYEELRERDDIDIWNDFFKKLFFEGLSKKGKSPDIVGTVPYLNGGLFEKKEYEDEVEIDQDFFEALLNPKRNREGEKKGFLLKYRLKLSESNPSEQELVIDPEFIGRIFEMSMQQDEEERGAKGAFYTPKDITQYMSKNSIKHFLLTHLPDKEEELSKLLLNYSIDDSFTHEELRKIKKELKEINVLDPAVGSGAFIIAVMEELVRINEAINEEIGEKENRYDLKEDMIANNLYGVDIDPAGIELCKFRTWLHLMQDLDKNLKQLKENYEKYALPNLGFKFFVGNSLSGDFKPIKALQKIQEEGSFQKTLKEEDTDPLVNAEEDKNSVLSLIDRIEEKREKFTETHDREKKKKIEKEIITLTERLENSIDWSKTDYYMSEVVKESGDDFKWSIKMPEVMAEGGFDIVIGNPPYVGGAGSPPYVNKLGEFLAKYYPKYKKVAGMQYDPYQKFIIRAEELTKSGGIISYITSRTFLTIESKETSRKVIQDNRPESLIIANEETFDNSAKPAIFTIKKGKKRETERMMYIDASEINIQKYRSLVNLEPSKDRDKLKKKDIIYDVPVNLYRNTFHRVFFEPNRFNKRLSEGVMSEAQGLMEDWEYILRNTKRMKKNKNKIEEFNEGLSQSDVTLLGLSCKGGLGVKTGGNNEFLAFRDGTDGAKKIKAKYDNFKYVEKNAESDDLKRGELSRVVREEDIANISELTDEEKRNGISNDKRKVWVPVEKGFKSGEEYYKKSNLCINWSKRSLEGIKNTDNGLLRNMDMHFESGIYLVIGGRADLRARYSENKVIISGHLFIPRTETLSPKYLLGIINSEICKYIYETFINKSGVSTTYLRFLPIKIPTQKEKEQLESLVNKAIEHRKDNNDEDFQKLTEEINKLVKKIYGVYLDD